LFPLTSLLALLITGEGFDGIEEFADDGGEVGVVFGKSVGEGQEGGQGSGLPWEVERCVKSRKSGWVVG